MNLAEKRRDFLSSERPFSELVPWAVRLGPAAILLKDGSVMVCYRMRGLDPDQMDAAGYERIVELMDQAWKLMDERGSLWVNMSRVRLNDSAFGWWPPEQQPERPRLDHAFREVWRTSILKSRWYDNRVLLSILLAPERSLSGRYLDRVGRLTEDGLSLPRALIRAARSSVESMAQLRLEAVGVTSLLAELEATAAQIADVLSPLAPTRLSGDELVATLHDLVSPGNAGQPVHLPETEYLDTGLPDSFLDARGRTLRFEGAGGERHLITLSVRAWPECTLPGLLDGLLQIDGTLTYTLSFRFCSPERAEAAIRQARAYHLALQVSFKNYIKQAMGRTSEPVTDRPQHVRYVQEADAALSNLSSERFGYLGLAISCSGDTAEQAESLAQCVTQMIQQLGFIVIREGQYALGTFASTLPGQWAESVRWRLMTTATFSDLFPARLVQPGAAEDVEFSKNTGSRIGPLAVFPTGARSLYRHLPTVGGVGHTIVVGPTGAGKSTLMNFLISHWLGYPRARVYVFDQKYSCRIPIVLQGGRYIDLVENDDFHMNPLGLLSDEREVGWVAEWVQALMETRDRRLDAREALAVTEAVKRVRAAGEGLWTLSNLVSILPDDLQPLLGEWVRSGGGAGAHQAGRYSRFFDNARDDFKTESFIGVELGLLARQSPRVAVAALEYMDRKIRRSLDGSPTFIYVEEAWFALSDPHFSVQIDIWLRTLRSLNGVVYLATQSLTEIAESPSFGLLLDSIPNRVFLPNAHAATQQRDLYMQKFGLNARQVEIIAQARPRHDYYLSSDGGGRLVGCGLSGWMRDLVRSDRDAIQALDAACGSPNPAEAYFRSIHAAARPAATPHTGVTQS